MNRADFLCNQCGKKTEFVKANGNDNFPEKIECCHCKSMDTRRVWSGKINIPQSFKAV